MLDIKNKEATKLNEHFKLFMNKGKTLENINLNNFFPDLDEKTLELIENDKYAKNNIAKWLENEILGSQFNAIRVCCVPKDVNETKNNISFSNEYCESFKMCPFYRNGNAPEGSSCPLEKLQCLKITEELIKELEIDIYEDYTDKYLIAELIMCTLLENRAFRGLSCTNLGFTNIKMTKGGKEYSRQSSYYLEIISTMQRLKKEIRKSLIATREEKIKLKQTKTINVQEQKMQEVVEKIKIAEIPLIEDAELNE